MTNVYADASVNPQNGHIEHLSGKAMFQRYVEHPYDLKLQGGVL